MLISCPKCHSVYEIPDDLVPNSGQNFRCSLCSNVWNVIPSDALGFGEEDDDEVVIEALDVKEPPYRKYPSDKNPYEVVQDTKSGKKTLSSKEVVEKEGDKNYVMPKPQKKKKNELTLTSDLGTSFTISMDGGEAEKEDEFLLGNREIRADARNKLLVKKMPKFYVKTKMFLGFLMLVWALFFLRAFVVMVYSGAEKYYNKIGLSGYDNVHNLLFGNVKVEDVIEGEKKGVKIVAEISNNGMFASKVLGVMVGGDENKVFKPQHGFLKAKEKTKVEILLDDKNFSSKAYKIEFVK